MIQFTLSLGEAKDNINEKYPGDENFVGENYHLRAVAISLVERCISSVSGGRDESICREDA